MKKFQADTPWADDVRRAAAILYEAGATAVWLFGSRASSRAVDRLSDFDLAVEGLPGGVEPFLRAARELHGKVDILRLESVSPHLRWGILQNRVLVPQVAYAESPPRPKQPLPDSLAGLRTRRVAQLVRDISPRSVIDFGCGSGWLLAELAADADIRRLTGVDFNARALAEAKGRTIKDSSLGEKNKIEWLERIITHRDPAYLGHDVATAVEVIEHLEQLQLRTFVSVVFSHVRPKRVVITTPNAEYNLLWFKNRPNCRRHPDHRFEWSRAEFATWANKIAAIYVYQVDFQPLGSVHPVYGSPTQVAVFDLIRPGAS